MLFFWYLNMDDDIIKKELQFYGFMDFFRNKDNIKSKYELLTTKEKRIYKMYVYSTCFETEFAKDLIWEFLNCNDKEYYTDLGIFREYGKRRRKCQ